jgi:hypothetical protein
MILPFISGKAAALTAAKGVPALLLLGQGMDMHHHEVRGKIESLEIRIEIVGRCETVLPF